MRVILSVFLLLGFAANTVASSGSKIAVVDIQLAIESSHHVSKINKVLEQEFGPAESDLKALQNEIIAMEERYVKDAAIMSETEVRRLQQEMTEKKGRLRFEGQELQRKAAARQQELTRPLLKLVDEVLKEFESEGKYDLIIRREAVLVFNKGVDLTQQLTEKLNKKK